jgi:DUF3037 family protein
MANPKQLEFFLLRYAPDAVKEEFVNIGVVLAEPNGGFADVRFTRDWRRVKCLDAAIDIEMLQALEQEIRERIAPAGPGRDLMLRKVLQDSFSGTLQVSTAKGCLAESPQKELELLAAMYLESAPREREAREPSGRAAIFQAMRSAFDAAGIWEVPQMRKRIAVAEFTRPGDPLKIDCGYRPNGVVRLFHAVALESDPDAAKVLAYSLPQIVAGIERTEQAGTELTAVIEDAAENSPDDEIRFALETLRQGRISVAPVGELAKIAQRARTELRL